MVKRWTASLYRAASSTGDKLLLARRLPRVSRFDGVESQNNGWSPGKTLAVEQRSNTSSSGAPSSPSRISLSRPVIQCSDNFGNSCLRESCCLSGEASGSLPCAQRWRAPSPCRRAIGERCGFATAAINVVEPGKSWRGKGWNRVGSEEAGEVGAVELQTGPSSASQFDSIPDLEEKLKFLGTCGLRENQVEQMRKRLPSAVKNTILKLTVKKLVEVATFMEEEAGVQRQDFGKVLFVNPYIAGSRMQDCLLPKIEYLRSRGISKEQLGKMVLRSPQILTYSLEGKLLAIEKKLLELGLKGDEVGKIFVKHPSVFGTSISKFDKNLQSLRDGGVTDLAKAILKLPQIMSLSLDTKLEQIMHYLRDDLKLQQDQVTKIVSCQISILSFSIEENIRPKVGYFSEMGLQQNDIARLVMRYPSIFCHSLDNSIKPKVQYLLKVMNLDVLELTAFPQFLSYSLQSRIIPRYEHVAKHDLSFRLSSLLSCCDAVFQKRYAKAPSGQLEEPIVKSV